MRRYDIDWLRVVAIGLLLIYHTAITFQPWGVMIGFISNPRPWESLWTPMTLLNVWRIPLLFFVSGMGVFFAIQQRSWRELLVERMARIGIPFVFGIFFIVPIAALLSQYHDLSLPAYAPGPGHLWFLGNILAYVLILSPVFYYLKRNESGKFVTRLKFILGKPAGIILVLCAFVAEVLIARPVIFEWYAMTWHGFFLGFLAFFFGFCFVWVDDGFWKQIAKWRCILLVAAGTLYIWRQSQFPVPVAGYRLSIESNLWILTILAFGYRYLNRPSRALAYLSHAAYPVYILHMIFLSLGAMVIFPWQVPVPLQFVLLLLFALAGSLMTYEFIIRRVTIIRPLFGVKMR
ncbi:MAG TPA: acyltransferase family protein [Cyclobacteriaceae bacterium]|nr:acyltransferase family protein [Cyclobacteriaceae bacterium]